MRTSDISNSNKVSSKKYFLENKDNPQPISKSENLYYERTNIR